jgi:hypothetical protein
VEKRAWLEEGLRRKCPDPGWPRAGGAGAGFEGLACVRTPSEAMPLVKEGVLDGKGCRIRSSLNEPDEEGRVEGRSANSRRLTPRSTLFLSLTRRAPPKSKMNHQDLPVVLHNDKRGLLTIENGRFDVLQLSRDGRRKWIAPHLPS